MQSLKTMWQLLVSIPLAIIWSVLVVLLYLGWGKNQVDKFIVAWNNSMEDHHTGGPLPPDPAEPSLPGLPRYDSNAAPVTNDRHPGEGIG